MRYWTTGNGGHIGFCKHCFISSLPWCFKKFRHAVLYYHATIYYARRTASPDGYRRLADSFILDTAEARVPRMQLPILSPVALRSHPAPGSSALLDFSFGRYVLMKYFAMISEIDTPLLPPILGHADHSFDISLSRRNCWCFIASLSYSAKGTNTWEHISWAFYYYITLTYFSSHNASQLPLTSLLRGKCPFEMRFQYAISFDFSSSS